MKEDVEELLDQAFDAIEELMESLDTLSNHSNPKWVNLAKATDALSNGKLALDAINQALYEDL